MKEKAKTTGRLKIFPPTSIYYVYVFLYIDSVSPFLCLWCQLLSLPQLYLSLLHK